MARWRGRDSSRLFLMCGSAPAASSSRTCAHITHTNGEQRYDTPDAVRLVRKVAVPLVVVAVRVRMGGAQ